MSTEAAPVAPAPARRWTSAALIALVYAFAGPPIGALIVLPAATIAASQLGDNGAKGVAETLGALLFVIPIGLIFSYWMAGAIALVTGIATAGAAYRRGIVPLGAAFAVTMLVYGAFLLMQQVFHGSVPGAALLRGEGRVGPGLGAIVSVLSSLACWRLTRPLQRRLA